jgi:hypothetical protein
MKTSAVWLCSFLLIALSTSSGQRDSKTKVTQSEISSIAQAVEDEIYDYEYEEHFFPEGGPVGDAVSSTRVRVPLYVYPEIKDGEGRTIYKLMPHGEVIRYFHVQRDGTVRLEGDPQLRFPASQPSRKTVYLRDDELCRMKRDWVKSAFDVDLSPESERIQDAVRRQKQRNDGFSAWEFARSQGGKPKQ